MAGHADGLPGPALEDCGPPGERPETCTADQLLWEDRVLIAAGVAAAATAAAAIAAVTAATAAVVRDVLARRSRA